MESEIQKAKQKLINEIDLYIDKGIEDFSQVLTDLSLKFLAKTKEREIELNEQVEQLQGKKQELEVYINGAKEKASDFIKKEKELNKRDEELKTNEKELDKIKEGVMADLKMIEASKKSIQKEKDDFDKEKQQFKVKQAMVEEQVKTLRKLNI